MHFSDLGAPLPGDRDTTRIGQVKAGAGAAAGSLSLSLRRRTAVPAAPGREFAAASGAQPRAAAPVG